MQIERQLSITEHVMCKLDHRHSKEALEFFPLDETQKIWKPRVALKKDSSLIKLAMNTVENEAGDRKKLNAIYHSNSRHGKEWSLR